MFFRNGGTYQTARCHTLHNTVSAVLSPSLLFCIFRTEAIRSSDGYYLPNCTAEQTVMFTCIRVAYVLIVTMGPKQSAKLRVKQNSNDPFDWH
jgi:hypothetical protein